MCANFRRYSAAVFRVSVAVLFALASGCATFSNSNFGPLPQSDDDFRKPPAELQTAFAGVRETPGQLGTWGPKFSDLASQWGTSQSKQIDMRRYIGGRAPLSVFFLSLIGPTGLGAGVAAIPWVINPPKEYVHTYDKGDYRVRVHTVSVFGTDGVTNWDWTHHAVSGDTELFTSDAVPPPTDDAPSRLRFISRVGAMFGSGWARNKFDSRHPKLEGGMDLAYGAEFSAIPADALNIALLLGYRTPDAVNANSDLGLNIIEFPLQVTVERRILPDIKIGAGVAKHFNPQLKRNYLNNVTLDAPIGVLFTGEYKLNSHFGVGIKAEHLNYKINNEPNINGDSISLTVNFN